MEGQILGNRYELLEKIGGGGMAVVYKAKCRLLNRFVAVKILRDEFTNDEEFVKRFRIEAQAAASLSHPNIVPIFDVGCENNTHYIVMEFIDGITLKEYISRKGALKWKEAVNIAIQICQAIEQAHKNHIVHRDIKPHNILLTREGIVKVTDFGIARAVTSSTITMVGSTIGSVHYFSPEQARGGFTDEKSDLYSLGITIYEMCTGKVPFDGDSPVAVALKHIQDKAVRPVDLNPAIPISINNIIMKAIKKDQNARYQSASELLEDLQKALRGTDMKFDNEKKYINEIPTKKMRAVKDTDYTPDDSEGSKNMDYEDTEDEEDYRYKGRKKDRFSVWLGVITGLVIVSIFFYIGFRIVMPAIMPEETQDFVVQNYVNKDFQTVQDELRKYNIQAVEDKQVYSDYIKKGLIISQDVEENQTLKPGGVIKFQVSDGPELVTIPGDIAGEESRIGEQTLKDMQFKTVIEKENSDTVGTGLIIRTEPAPGEQVKPGSTVTIYESLGPALVQVKVPNIVGLTREDAEKLILDNKLTIGTITPSDVISDVAKITEQNPTADTVVNEGTPVDITFGIDQTPEGTDNGGAAPTSTTGVTAGNGNEEQNNPGNEAFTIYLRNPDKYGDQVHVYIEATPAGATNVDVLLNRDIEKSLFPISVQIPKNQNGLTHVVVILDGVLVQEGDY